MKKINANLNEIFSAILLIKTVLIISIDVLLNLP